MLEGLELWTRKLVEDYGYIGIFLISFSESIAQPIPPDPFIMGGSAFGLNPILSAFIATAGSILGGLTAHTLGMFLGEGVAKKLLGEKNYLKGEALFNRFGVWAVLLAALTPIPFKAVCWLAGIFEMPRLPFLLASLIGRFPRFMAVALFGDFLRGIVG
jgi:membrane protein YqaA with SNARE-associated domain